MGRLQNFLGDQQLTKGKKGFKVIRGTCQPPLPPAIKPLWKCCVCEFIGTFLLIFIGCAVGMRFKADQENTPWTQTALCWGFLIASLCQTLHYSADINPAVTLAKTACGIRSPLVAVIYIIIQCTGCLAGAYALKLLSPDPVYGNYGITTLPPEITPGQAVIIEAICTFFLVFTCFSADDEERSDVKGSIPLSVGLCVAGMIMAVGPYTAASFNPARTLGPSIVAGNFDDHWVFWVGPIVGGTLGGLTYHHIFRLRRMSDIEPRPAIV